METIHSNLPSTPASAAKASEQPTYTTVGSIYNPTNTQPIQPPARRGRTLKWPPPNQQDLAFLPRSALPGLALSSPSPSGSGATIQQYSPLQQNYDRAVSPVTDQEQAILATMGMPVPGAKPENMPPGITPPPGFRVPGPPNKHGHRAKMEDDSDEDSDMQDTLIGLPVKSLASLASYDNPMQKAAKKTLARARPAMTSNTNLVRPLSSLSYASSEYARDKVAFPSQFRHGQYEPTPIGSYRNTGETQAQVQAQARRDHKSSMSGVQEGLHGGLRYGSNAQIFSSNSFTTLSTGPGAPEPLKAGPPGQRQYSASSFGGQLSRLQESAQRSQPQTLQDALSFTYNQHPAASLASSSIPQPSQRGSPYGEPRPRPRGVIGERLAAPSLQQALRSVSAVDYSTTPDAQSSRNIVQDTLPFDQLNCYFRNGRPSNATKDYRPVAPNWCEGGPLFKPRQHRKTAQQIMAHNAKIDAVFYTGTGKLSKSMGDVIRDVERRKFEAKVGIIGEERARIRRSKVVHKPFTVEEANAMPASEHSEPLLCMAFGSLLEYVENPARGRFTRAVDRSLFNNTRSGESSFFD